MGLKPRIGTAQRRARLARNHLLAPAARVTTPLDVARGIVALHATDPATVFLSAAARLQQPTAAAIECALYDERSLIRMLGMRRTMFVVTREMAAIVQAACTQAIAAQQRKLAHQLFAAAGLAEDVPTWLVQLEEATYGALVKRGEATAQELGQDVPALKTQILMAAGKDYSALQGIATRVLLLLSADGRIVRGRPRGSWISSQYRWATLAQWLDTPFVSRAPAEAQTELLRAWLHTFGPGTLADLKWWSG
ncbi:MAG TPA: crosslink repair DNA glycosylase YcaQ family protein, partial [Chloroflexota bacterium]|nr:crosslink repair DNA glycosylase YcaQ family protein [Chloroflexota bacterium]